jgi:adenosylmethionine-8-amino-7-oxononanoate aminotransferase
VIRRNNGILAFVTVNLLRDVDARHVWHPYAAMPARIPSSVVDSASGVRLRLADGRELVDGMSSWWAAIHGYRHPVLDAAITSQLTRMAHVMFGGLTHEPAVRLAEQLVAVTPEGLEHVFFSDSGSVAVEVAIKMALQFQMAVGQPAKARLLTIRGGYHGDTLGAMSVSDPVSGMHNLFAGVLPAQIFAPRPPPGLSSGIDEAWLEAVLEIFATRADEIAAVIVEPVVQGAGGMRFYDPCYLRMLRTLCDRHDALLIFDEIATGFGRTGELFAAEFAGVSPDIMCIGKALTGGYVSMAATLCTAEVAQVISDGPGGAFMHGPTFMANPLAAAVASASLTLLLGGDWRSDVRRIEDGLRLGLAELRGVPGVADVRVLGAIGVVELESAVDMRRATEASIDAGVWLRPFGNLIYAMPPYVCSDSDVQIIAAGIRAAVMASVL